MLFTSSIYEGASKLLQLGILKGELQEPHTKKAEVNFQIGAKQIHPQNISPILPEIINLHLYKRVPITLLPISYNLYFKIA